MKQSIKYLVLINILTIGFLLGVLLTTNANASSLDLIYAFESSVLYDNDSIEYSDNFNLQNTYNSTGVYNATYSFTDELGLENEVISFVDIDDSGLEATVKVIEELEGHNEILNLTAVINSDNADIHNTFIPYRLSGTIEGWVRTTYITPWVYFCNLRGGSNAIFLTFSNGYLRVYNGDINNLMEATINTWYHFRIDFECKNGNYLGLDNDTARVYINGVNYGIFNFEVDVNYINDLRISVSDDTQTHSLFIDAYGYSWQPIHDFNNDIIGNEPIGWTSDNDEGCTTTIIESFDSEYKVLELYDNNNSGNLAIKTNINQEADQTIEFDVAKSSIAFSKEFVIQFLEGTNIIIHLELSEDDLASVRFPLDMIKEDFIIVNTFFRIKIILDDTLNEFDCYVDGVLEANNLDYYGASSVSIDTIRFNTDTEDYQFYSYIDNINISSDNGYKVGDNMYPNYNVSGLEVSRDEFAFDSNGLEYEIGVKDACGWEGNDITYVYLIQDDEQSYDKMYKIHNTGTTANKFIRKYYDINDGIFNFSLKISYLKMLNLDSSYYWTIYATLTEIIALIEITYVAGDWNLNYCDDIDLETFTLIGILDETYNMDRFLTLGINETCYFTYNDSHNFYEASFPKTEAVDGLYQISFAGSLDDTSTYQTIYIDNIGVFVNDTNINNDFGVLFHDLSVSGWSSQYHNLVEINANGYFAFAYYTDIFESLRGFSNYTGINNFNIYDKSFYINNPVLCFITNKTIEILEITISGVRLKEGSNTYVPTFHYSSVNIDESYFYVDSSNRLRFTLISNDNDTEWIELSFLLFYIPNENRTVSFKSNINGIAQGYVHLAYWGWETTDIFFPYYEKTTTSNLPQSYVIYTLSVIVSDFDITYYDTCEGYITNLKLLWTPEGIASARLISIVIANLIMIIIPLIVLIAPSLAISIKFGKKSILPMFILMSVVCVATQLIPIWLFFIMILGSGALLIAQYKKGDD